MSADDGIDRLLAELRAEFGEIGPVAQAAREFAGGGMAPIWRLGPSGRAIGGDIPPGHVEPSGRERGRRGSMDLTAPADPIAPRSLRRSSRQVASAVRRALT
jgi:hypothetical protein